METGKGAPLAIRQTISFCWLTWTAMEIRTPFLRDGVRTTQTRDSYSRKTGGEASSSCARTCRLVPDERTALDTEIGRLQGDNKQLREQLAQQGTVTGKTDAPLAKEDSKKSAQAVPDGKSQPDGKIELQLPPEHEKLLALIERVWERLIDMANRMQKKLSEKI